LLAVTFLLPAEAILFSPQAYQQAMSAENIYQRVPGWLAELFFRSGGPNGESLQARALKYLPRQESSELFGILFPVDWVRSQADALVVQGLDYLNFHSDDLYLRMDLQPVKARLNGAEGGQVAERILASWPDCTAEQVLQMGADLLFGNTTEIPFCRPPAELMPVAQGLLASVMQGFGAVLPDQVDLAAGVRLLRDSSSAAGARWQQLFGLYTFLRWMLRLSPLFALVLGAMIFLLTYPEKAAVLDALGYPMLLSGLAGIVAAGLAFVFMGVVPSTLLEWLVPGGAALSGLSEILSAVFGRVGVYFSVLSGAIALLILLVGLGMIVAAHRSEPLE